MPQRYVPSLSSNKILANVSIRMLSCSSAYMQIVGRIQCSAIPATRGFSVS